MYTVKVSCRLWQFVWIVSSIPMNVHNKEFGWEIRKVALEKRTTEKSSSCIENYLYNNKNRDDVRVVSLRTSNPYRKHWQLVFIQELNKTCIQYIIIIMQINRMIHILTLNSFTAKFKSVVCDYCRIQYYTSF